ncbi:putative MIP18 family protein [Trypanosoma theileri]|uniref:Putative MIP18 family protein n=1 Tax=Trypanosoma theileri TaxID=67003 RepID=A0A1X0P633_9TRYP|nr:putative MIP18 family protein [Trypanosoma theileri]ORC92019.1 putative MIP18 family protein [Trypanosoma theileri]
MNTVIYTEEDVFYEISTIRDPERTIFTLAELDVVAPERCSVTYNNHEGLRICMAGNGSACGDVGVPKPTGLVMIVLKPTVPHCSLMGIICLSVYAKLKEVLPSSLCDWKIDITLVEGSHLQQDDVEKQIADKERVAAALENETLVKEIDRLINADGD